MRAQNKSLSDSRFRQTYFATFSQRLATLDQGIQLVFKNLSPSFHSCIWVVYSTLRSATVSGTPCIFRLSEVPVYTMYQ